MNQTDLFEKAPVHKAYFKLTAPVVLSMVLSVVYNMVDTYFIAKTGDTNLIAGVSLCAPILTCLNALSNIPGLGGSSLISRLFGMKKDDDGRRISAFSFYGGIGLGVVTAAILLILQNPILRLLGAESDTMAFASQYYLWIAIGAPFIIFANVPNNLLRTEGYSQIAMIGMVMGSIANMILDPIFIFALGMGAAGAAVATVLGSVLSCAFFVWFLIKKSKKLTLDPRGMRVTKRELGQILSIGLPGSITNFMSSFSMALTNRFLLAYGTEAVAAMGIASKVSTISLLVMVGFAFGTQPLIGYCYGAGNEKRLRDVLGFSYKFECAIGVALAALIAILANPLMRLFTQDETLIGTCVEMLRCQQIGMLFVAIILVTTCTFQSMGKSLYAFVLSISRQGVVFAIVIVIMSNVMGYMGILISQAIADAITAAIAGGLAGAGARGAQRIANARRLTDSSARW